MQRLLQGLDIGVDTSFWGRGEIGC